MATDHVETLITLESSNQPVSEALRLHGHDEIQKVAEKYFGHLVSAKAHFTADGFQTRCSITMQMGGLPSANAYAADKDMKLAFDHALDKVATQLRRAKREIREDKPARIDKGILPDGSRVL